MTNTVTGKQNSVKVIAFTEFWGNVRICNVHHCSVICHIVYALLEVQMHSETIPDWNWINFINQLSLKLSIISDLIYPPQHQKPKFIIDISYISVKNYRFDSGLQKYNINHLNDAMLLYWQTCRVITPILKTL